MTNLQRYLIGIQPEAVLMYHFAHGCDACPAKAYCDGQPTGSCCRENFMGWAAEGHMDNDKLIQALRCCARVDAKVNGCDDCPLEYCGTECEGLCGAAADAMERMRVQLAEKDKQLSAAVEELRGLCWCCSNGKKWDKAPGWSNMTTCKHIRERSARAVGGGKAGKDCPHWKWRGPQEAGEGEG